MWSKGALASAFLALVHGGAGLTILVISSWFIAISAVAPVGFNYVIPAVVIRGLALIRIGAGYASMWLGHKDLLERLADERLLVFKQLRHKKINHKAWTIEALASHTENLASAWIAWIAPFSIVTLLMLWVCVSCTLLALPGAMLLWGLFILWLYAVTCLSIQSLHIAQKRKNVELLFRKASDVFLRTSALWHLDQQVDYSDSTDKENLGPQADTVWSHTLKQSTASALAAWGFQGVAFTLVVFSVFNGNVNGYVAPLAIVVPMILLAAPDWASMGFSAVAKFAQWQMSKNEMRYLKAQPLHQIDNVTLRRQLKLRNFSVENRHIPALNFALPSKGIVMLKGHSGSGKSSVLQAIAGVLPYKGERELDGNIIDAGLVKNWCYVEQYPVVLSGSVKLNLDPAATGINDNRMGTVLASLGLNSLLPLNQWIGKEGRALSGGEAKRLSLARATLSTPSVLLVDEPFEGLDDVNQVRVIRHLNAMAHHCLVIVASHISASELAVDSVINMSDLPFSTRPNLSDAS